MSNWRSTTVADICERVDYGYTASASEDPGLPRFLRITDIVGSHIDWPTVPGCVIEKSRLARFQLQEGDIVVARTGATVGYAKRIRSHPDAVFASYLVRFRPAYGIEPGYLGAVMESSAYKEWVRQNAGGAAQPNANAKTLGAFPIRVPDLPTQRRIGAILDKVGDLIENNRLRAKVLEELARTIYQEWFVRFRYPGHEKVPLVDSPLGAVPDGWGTSTVSEITETVTRGIAPKYAADGDWTVINQKCVRGQRIDLDKARRQRRAVPLLKQVRIGDVLINSTGVGTLGRAAFCLLDHPSLTVDTHVTIARPSIPQANPWFGLALVGRQIEFEQLATGSTGQTELSRSDIGALQIVVPPESLRRAFADYAWPLLLSTRMLLDRNRSLTALRDLLVPKLVTGEIDVSHLDLDELTEAAIA